jgi:DNA-directed RNA polymerase subunit RPC12/RpoP
MTFELVKCPYCGYVYRTDLEKVTENGKTVLVRVFGLPDVKEILGRKKAKSFYLDLKCPNCGKEFEWEVKE